MYKNLIFLMISNNKYGYVNLSNEVVIPFEYDKTSEIIHDSVWIKKDNKWNFVNYKNIQTIKESFDELISNNNDYSIVKKKNTYYLINHLNDNIQIKINKKYTPISISKNNILKVKTNELLYGFLNEKLEILIEPIYQDANDFFDEYASVKNNKWGIINNKNKIIIDFEYDLISKNCTEFIKVEKDKENYFIDKHNNQYLKNFNKKYKLYEFNNLMLPFEYKNKKGYMNQFFEIDIIGKFNKIFPFENDMAIVIKNNKYGVIHKSSRWVLKPIYDNILNYNGESFLVEKNKKYNHINILGNPIFKEWR